MAECSSKRSAAAGDLRNAPPQKNARSLAKKSSDKERNKTRVNIGLAFPRWRALRAAKGLHLDSELAFLLLDAYVRTKSESRPDRQTTGRSSSTETCQSVHCEFPFVMTSSSEGEQDTCAEPSIQSSEDGTESRPRQKSPEWMTANNREDEEEFSTSLSVGDGRHLVDLGSSSEFIVDEECILQLFKSCRECDRQCTVKKHVKGLKLVVYQACGFCQSRCKWTNLPDDDDGDFQMNGKDAAHGQTNSAGSSSSNTS